VNSTIADLRTLAARHRLCAYDASYLALATGMVLLD
jgi:predicted nucleic acid-binding protein